MRKWLSSKWASVKAWSGRQYHKAIAFLLTLLAGIGVVSYAETFDITWTHPTQRVDGSTLDPSDIAETRFYCNGSLVATVPAPADVGQLELGVGEWTCHATTVDTNNEESDPSNTITRRVLPGRPNPPIVNDDPVVVTQQQ